MTFDEWFHKEYEPADLQIKQYAERKEGLHIPATVYIDDLKKAFEAGQKGKVVERFEAYGQCRDSRRIVELEAQIAELKKKNLATQDAVTMQMYTNKANKEIADRQLTKAKEIIKKFSEFVNNDVEYNPEHPQEHTDSWNKLYENAEQFLNCSEKPNN